MGRLLPPWRWCSKRAQVKDELVLELPLVGRSDRPSNYVKTARYTLLNFLFKCGLEQFRNLSNVYFLVISVLALLGTHTNLFESPYSAAGTLLGLFLVVGFTMCFEGYYDVKRHREDKEVNNRKAFRLRPGDGHMEEIAWAEVKPGDLLKVYDRSQFPADLLFVTSCAVGNKCYVETANIDGETNLKIKHVPKDLVSRCILPDQAASLRAVINYDMPNAFLTFSGRMRVYDDERYMERTPQGHKDISLDSSSLLLRGSVLRNTPWVLGIVLYAGPETKVVQSSSDPPTKMSRIQKLINKIIILILMVDLVLCTISALIEIYKYPSNTEFYYLKQFSENTFSFPAYVANVCTFIVLYSSMLPISLLFCMTFSNFWQAMFVHWDLDMYHEETDTRAKCNTMELVQELGQVSYLFSDKTGTLTRNEMKLVGCTIQGEMFGVGNTEQGQCTSSSSIRTIFDSLVRYLHQANTDDFVSATSDPVVDFLIVLSVCHTVLVDTSSGSIQYNAEGPDEEALVSAAADVGFRLVSTDNGVYEVCIDPPPLVDREKVNENVSLDLEEDGQPSFAALTETTDRDAVTTEDTQGDVDEMRGKRFKFEILAINQFNSTRKRMSVVCRTPDGRCVLLSKGADTIMFDLSKQDTTAEELQSRTTLINHLDAFANDGLRTLVMGKRELSEEEYLEWKTVYDNASSALGEKRAEMLAEAAEKIECGLTIVGASAIEDRLQDGVPETLVALREAGVKTWVLTGDKVETAINIAFSARLFTPEMELVQVTSDSTEENFNNLLELHRLLVPKNLAEDSEKRRKGREAVKQRSGKNLFSQHASSTISSLGKAVHGVTSTTVHTLTTAMSVVKKRPNASPHEPLSASATGEQLTSPRSPKTSFFSLGRSSHPRAESVSSELHNDEEDLSGDEACDLQSSASIRSRSRTEPETPSMSPKTQGNNDSKAKRRSIPSLSRLWSSMTQKDSQEHHRKRKSTGNQPPPHHTTQWRSTGAPAPPGVDNAEEIFNERELHGTEKNLDGFVAKNMALILSGPALRSLLKEEHGSPETEALLLSIARLCSVVVACRVSPRQKALIVRMVKKGVKLDDGSSPITLAIGDGANDVAMIQEARVGVGISGHEGRQAVNSADFAIAQFRFLQQLMLVHGRWNYRRAATMVLFVFYANILFVLTAFVYNFWNKFSGSALYWVFLTTVYSYPTQVPIAVIACLNKDISRKTALEYPAMYISGRRNLHLDRASALEYIFKSFLHAFLISAICIIWAAPTDLNISVMGTTVYMACILVCVSRACLETYTWTWINFAIIAFGFFAMFVFEPIYYSSDPTIFVRFGPTVLYASSAAPGYLWSTVGLVTIMCVSYDVVAVYIRKEYFPSLIDIVIEIDRGFGGEDSEHKKFRLRKINKFFRKIAQPLTIPQTAISELLASANLKIIRRGADRSAFYYDMPEDERVLSLVRSLLNSGTARGVSLKLADSGQDREIQPMSSPLKKTPFELKRAASTSCVTPGDLGEIEMSDMAPSEPPVASPSEDTVLSIPQQQRERDGSDATMTDSDVSDSDIP